MMHLIIKGTRAEAATANGVTLHDLAAHEWRADSFETTAYAAVSQRDAIVRWFCQPGEAPYPAAALLWYGEE
jgi:hypothetical protein